MFTPHQRDALREHLIAAAQTDPFITGAALTGSAAGGREDQWSDIDLAFQVASNADFDRLVAVWTDRLYRDHEAIHHLDVAFGDTLFRVFLLTNTLQVDLAFWPESDFGAIGPTFQLLFGTANEIPPAPQPTANEVIGTAWLYALHARSAIARNKAWQAEYMISAMRDQVLALACLRHGLPASHGRGMDDLPPDLKATLGDALVCSLEPADLIHAFEVVRDALLHEVERIDSNLASRLTEPLIDMVSSV